MFPFEINMTVVGRWQWHFPSHSLSNFFWLWSSWCSCTYLWWQCCVDLCIDGCACRVVRSNRNFSVVNMFHDQRCCPRDNHFLSNKMARCLSSTSYNSWVTPLSKEPSLTFYAQVSLVVGKMTLFKQYVYLLKNWSNKDIHSWNILLVRGDYGELLLALFVISGY